MSHALPLRRPSVASRYDDLDASTELEQRVAADLEAALVKRGCEIHHNGGRRHAPGGCSDIEVHDRRNGRLILVETTKRAGTSADGEFAAITDHLLSAVEAGGFRDYCLLYVSPETSWRMRRLINEFFNRSRERDGLPGRVFAVDFATTQMFLDELSATPGTIYPASRLGAMFARWKEADDDLSAQTALLESVFCNEASLRAAAAARREARDELDGIRHTVLCGLMTGAMLPAVDEAIYRRLLFAGDLDTRMEYVHCSLPELAEHIGRDYGQKAADHNRQVRESHERMRRAEHLLIAKRYGNGRWDAWRHLLLDRFERRREPGSSLAYSAAKFMNTQVSAIGPSLEQTWHRIWWAVDADSTRTQSLQGWADELGTSRSTALARLRALADADVGIAFDELPPEPRETGEMGRPPKLYRVTAVLPPSGRLLDGAARDRARQRDEREAALAGCAPRMLPAAGDGSGGTRERVPLLTAPLYSDADAELPWEAPDWVEPAETTLPSRATNAAPAPMRGAAGAALSPAASIPAADAEPASPERSPAPAGRKVAAEPMREPNVGPGAATAATSPGPTPGADVELGAAGASPSPAGRTMSVAKPRRERSRDEINAEARELLFAPRPPKGGQQSTQPASPGTREAA